MSPLAPKVWNLDNLEFIDSNPTLGCQLIYLDPPYKSDRAYGSKEVGYSDYWKWGPDSERELERVKGTHVEGWGEFITLVLKRQDPSLAAYLAHLTPRLLGLHDMLAPTGTLVLQCDQSAEHWVRCTLDQVFGGKRFHSMVNWKRIGSHNKATRRCPPDTDYLLWYTRSSTYTWNQDVRVPYSEQYLKKCRKDGWGLYNTQPMTAPGKRGGEGGQPWRGIAPYQEGKLPRNWTINREVADQYLERTGKPLEGSLLERLDKAYEAGIVRIKGTYVHYRGYIDVSQGTQLQQTWLDIPPVSKGESVGFQTQKPIELLERVIRLATQPGDLVCDPYTGSGTTGVAAIRLGRSFIGCELNPQTAQLAQGRIDQELATRA